MAGETGWNRRDVVGAGFLLAGVVVIPAWVASVSPDDEDEVPSDRQRSVVAMVADLVIPRTDTPGAQEAGVADFVILALAHGLDGTRRPAASAAIPPAFPQYRRRDGTLRYVDWLADTLDQRASGDWLGAKPDRRAAVLQQLDTEAFREGPDESPWRKIKGLILTGYYTSQIGGAQELQFELVPGRYDPRVPLAPGARAFSSDWTAVDFG